MMHVWFIGFKGHPGEIAGKNMVRSLFLLKKVFLFSQSSEKTVLGFDSLLLMDKGGLKILGLVLPITLLLRSLM